MASNALAFLRRRGPSFDYNGPRTNMYCPMDGVYGPASMTFFKQFPCPHDGWLDSAYILSSSATQPDPNNYILFHIYNEGQFVGEKSVIMTVDTAKNTTTPGNLILGQSLQKLLLEKDERKRRVIKNDILRCQFWINGTINTALVHPKMHLLFT